MKQRINSILESDNTTTLLSSLQKEREQLMKTIYELEKIAKHELSIRDYNKLAGSIENFDDELDKIYMRISDAVKK